MARPGAARRNRAHGTGFHFGPSASAKLLRGGDGHEADSPVGFGTRRIGASRIDHARVRRFLTHCACSGSRTTESDEPGRCSPRLDNGVLRR